MRRGLITLMALTCALAPPATARAQEFDAGDLSTCYQWVPTVASATTTPVIDLHVHVVLDQGVSLEEGRAVMERAQSVYEPIGIRLRPNFTTTRTESDDADALMIELKSLFAGTRPPWAHVVYLMTKRDVASDGDKGYAGRADCIGGVAFDEGAFAFGEADTRDENYFGPLQFFMHNPAKIVGHEVAHLLGAHHQYSECVTGNAEAPMESSPCTLMFTDVSFASLSLSSPNQAIVRGHAMKHLKPVTAAPPPDGSPTLPPVLPACEITAYRDVRGDESSYAVNNPPDVDLVRGTFHTSPDGTVRFRWHVAELTGPAAGGNAFTDFDYDLDLHAPKVSSVKVTWDGVDEPSAEIRIDGRLTELKARVDAAASFVEVELPLAALGLAGAPLQLGQIRAGFNVDDDLADPVVRRIRPDTCSATAEVAPEAPGGGEATTPVAAPGVRLSLVDRSIRRRRLRARVEGDLRDVRIRLLDRRGRTVAGGRAARVAGSRVIKLRAKRRLRAGVHALTLSARGGVTRAIRVRLAR